jgi:S-disulfanyl-L-cysteine oxidoreductase SoxD
MGSLRLVAIVLPLGMLLLGSPAFAQSAPPYGVGRTPTAAEIRALDISIAPTGDELPPGRGTAKEGAQVFEQAGCIGCHGEAGIGGPAPALQSKTGQDVPIWKRERILPLRAPFATIVWDFIHRGMPLGNEGSLTADEVYAVTAYLLFLNKVIPEDQDSTKRVCRRSRCRLAMITPGCLTGSTGRPGFRVTPTSPSYPGGPGFAQSIEFAQGMGVETTLRVQPRCHVRHHRR